MHPAEAAYWTLGGFAVLLTGFGLAGSVAALCVWPIAFAVLIAAGWKWRGKTRT